MCDILVSKESDVFVKIVGEDSTLEELSDYFSFFSPGYEWSPRYKKHRWDGKTRLYNKRTHLLYAGLLRYVITFATSRNYSIEIDPALKFMNNFSLEEAKQYIQKLDIWSQGKPIEPRDYQIVGFAKAIRYKRILLLSPTNSGKSYMMYAISRYLLEHGSKKGLIIVPTINLVEQLHSDFRDYAHDTWDVDEQVHRIYQGHERESDKPLTISTWQSLDNIQSFAFFAKYDFVIGDEAHGFKANSLKAIMTKMVNAQYRVATTGTLNDWKIHRLIIEGLFGPNTKLTTTRRMIDEKQSADLQIKAIILKHPIQICSLASRWKKKYLYQKEIDYIVSCEARNRFIKNLSLSLEGNTLLLFQYIEKHGEGLYKSIKEAAESKRKVFFVHGITEAEEREEIRSLVEQETDAIIVASYGVFSQGVNIRNINNVIFTSPSKSKIRVLQSIGRGLRRTETKTNMTLIDIADDMRIDNFVNTTLKHFAARVKIYRNEEFKVSNYNIELK